MADKLCRRSIYVAFLVTGITVSSCSHSSMSRISIYEAVEQGDIKIVEDCIAQHVDINRPDQRGWTPLHLAVIAGNKEILCLLLDAGADIDKENVFWGSPLHLSLMVKNMDITKALIAGKADLRLANKYLGSPWEVVCELSYYDGGELLLASGVSPEGGGALYLEPLSPLRGMDPAEIKDMMLRPTQACARQEETDEIAEYLFRELLCRQARDKIYYLAVGWEDPADELIDRLKDLDLIVRKLSEGEFPEPEEGFDAVITDSISKKKGNIISVSLEWISDTEVNYSVWIYKNPRCGRGWVGTAKKQFDRWFYYRESTVIWI